MIPSCCLGAPRKSGAAASVSDTATQSLHNGSSFRLIYRLSFPRSPLLFFKFYTKYHKFDSVSSILYGLGVDITGETEMALPKTKPLDRFTDC